MVENISKIIFTILTIFALYNIVRNNCDCNEKEERILDVIQIIFIYIMFILYIDITIVLKGILIILISFFIVGLIRFSKEYIKQKSVQKTKKKCNCVK